MTTEEAAQIALNHIDRIDHHVYIGACKCRTDATCRRNMINEIQYARRVLTRIRFGTLKGMKRSDLPAAAPQK